MPRERNPKNQDPTPQPKNQDPTPQPVDVISAIIEKARSLGAIVQPKQSSLTVRIADPNGSRQKLSLFVINKSAQLYTGWLSEQMERIGMDTQIASDWHAGLTALVPDVQLHATLRDSLSRFIKIEELEPVLDEFITLLERTIDKINGNTD